MHKSLILMKKNTFLLFFLSLVCIGCNKHGEDVKVDPIDMTNRTAIEKNFCYEIQTLDEFGVPYENTFSCMFYDTICGHDFESAYKNLKPELNRLIGRLHEDYKNKEGWDAERIEIRETKCSVKNSPNTELTYTAINFFVYNIAPYNNYIIVTYYCVIDSEGNRYFIEFGDD